VVLPASTAASRTSRLNPVTTAATWYSPGKSTGAL
jgi:hypothetical protein